jgi:hypothetical protein
MMFKIAEITMTPNGRFRFSGKIREPGREMVDCAGFIPKDVSIMSHKTYLDSFCWGVVHHVNHTQAGYSVFLDKEINVCEEVEIHAGKVPSVVWHKALKVPCVKCGSKLSAWQRKFTSVKLKAPFNMGTHGGAPRNTIETICPECVIDKMYEGEFKDKHVHQYELAQAQETTPPTSSDTIQDGEPISPVVVNAPGREVVLSSPQTLQ